MLIRGRHALARLRMLAVDEKRSVLTYRKEIDGLRAMAILPVLFFHADFQIFRGGFVGVDVFFVISGYLITALILRERAADNFSLARFYERRARRILPALFFVMICCLPFAWLLLLPAELERFADSMIAVVLFLSNIHFYRETGYFASEAHRQVLLHSWSLSIEEQFYLLFPLLMTLLWSRGRRTLVPVIATLTLLSFMSAQLTVVLGGFPLGPWDDDSRAFGFFMPHTRIWELLAGALAAFYLHNRRPVQRGGGSLAFAGLIMILCAVITFDEDTPHPSSYTLLPVIGTVLIILFARPETLCARLLSRPLLVGIGLISYSVYLWHQPLFAFFRIQTQIPPSTGAFLVLALLALGLGWLSWRLIERPFRDRSRFSGAQILSYAGMAASLLIGLGLVGHYYEGFYNRYPPEVRHLLLAGDREKMGRYVYSRYKPYKDQPFAQDGRLKLLVIGDSYGQDVVNMLAEQGALNQVTLSIHEIPLRCGNLYLKHDFHDRIKAGDRAACISEGWFEGSQIQQNLREADVIIVASSWSLWVATLLPQSIQNLKKDFDARILLVGNKFFGSISPERYLDWDDNRKKSLTHKAEGIPVEVNDRLADHVGPDTFVNLVDLFCGAERRCPVFTPELELISYDGGHLTKAGAIHLGRLLMRHPLVRDALDLDLDQRVKQRNAH